MCDNLIEPVGVQCITYVHEPASFDLPLLVDVVWKVLLQKADAFDLLKDVLDTQLRQLWDCDELDIVDSKKLFLIL